MEITFTPEAKETISERLAGKKPNYLFLNYDIDGCGCVMCGVCHLTIKDELAPGDLLIETDFFPIIIEGKYRIFFDDQMKIDYTSQYSCFQLKSPNQILNPRMSFIQ